MFQLAPKEKIHFCPSLKLITTNLQNYNKINQATKKLISYICVIAYENIRTF